MNSTLTKSPTAQAATGGRYPRFGRYLLEVERIRTKEGFKGRVPISGHRSLHDVLSRQRPAFLPGLTASPLGLSKRAV